MKLKLQRGEKVTGGTLFSATDPATYCAMANAGYDFIWTEMQHNDRDWEAVARMWRTCPYAKAVPGRPGRVHRRARNPACARRRRARHHRADDRFDAGSDRSAQLDLLPAARAPQQRRRPGVRRRDVGRRARRLPQHDQRQRRADRDDRDARRFEGRGSDRESAGCRCGVRGERRSRQLLRLPPGTPDYERAINIVHDAAIKAGKRLCGPIAWRDRPDFTCFQAGSETAAIARGVAAELGNLANMQVKPEIGPFSSNK